jgi:hypothetical protein
MSGSFALLWLMRRKQPGKICRDAAVLAISVSRSTTEHFKIDESYQLFDQSGGHGTALA